MTKYRDFNFSIFMLFFCTAFLFSYSGAGQVKVSHFTSPADLDGKQGMAYALPRSVFKIDVVIDKVEEIKGPLASYASEMLNMDEVILRNTTTYSIKSIEVDCQSEPDPDQYYFVEIADKAQQLAEEKDFRLASHLIDLAVNAEPDNKNLHQQRAEIYQQRVQAETSLMAKGIFSYAVRTSEEKAGNND